MSSTNNKLLESGKECTYDEECSSGKCKGNPGRCCNRRGMTPGCIACDGAGDCIECEGGYMLNRYQCVKNSQSSNKIPQSDPNIPWDDWVGDTNNLRAAVKDILKKPTNLITEDTSITLQTKLNNTETTVRDLIELSKKYAYDFKSRENTMKNLNESISRYTNDVNKIKSDIDKKEKNEKVNKRIINFYNKDYELKKDITYYLKMIYIGILAFLVATVFYKKKHKEKKIYALIAALILIPFFLLHKIYLSTLNTIGHLKIDILYIVFIFMVSGISMGLFFFAKFIFKKSAKDAIDSIIKNPGKILDESKTKVSTKDPVIEKNTLPSTKK